LVKYSLRILLRFKHVENTGMSATGLFKSAQPIIFDNEDCRGHPSYSNEQS